MTKIIAILATLTLFGTFAFYIATHDSMGSHLAFSFENLFRGWAVARGPAGDAPNTYILEHRDEFMNIEDEYGEDERDEQT